MRKQLVVLGVALLLSACSDSTSSSMPTSTNTPAPQVSASSTLAASPSTPPSAMPSASPSVDYKGESLEGVPYCDWGKLTLKPDGQEIVRTPAGKMTDTVLTNFVARNTSGHSCVVRDAPSVALLDGSKELMSPVLTQTRPENVLPWVVRDGFDIHFFFQSASVSNASMCPETADYVKHVRLTFTNGKVMDFPLEDGLYACPKTTPKVETPMHMNIVQ